MSDVNTEMPPTLREQLPPLTRGLVHSHYFGLVSNEGVRRAFITGSELEGGRYELAHFELQQGTPRYLMRAVFSDEGELLDMECESEEGPFTDEDLLAYLQATLGARSYEMNPHWGRVVRDSDFRRVEEEDQALADIEE